MTDILAKATQSMLTEKDSIGSIFQELRELGDHFSAITGVGAHMLNKDVDVLLPTGKAIGPGGAAHCLLEGQRTAVFVRGIYKAIKKLQQVFPDERINILYAGCGPYATLLTPLTTVFSASEISFHLVDINEVSLSSARTLYENLGLTDYVAAYTLADAATYTIESADVYHLMISETMQQALKNEPQVAIMQNLIPQLPEQGIFIPQEIRVSAQLLDLAEETESFMTAGMVPDRVHLGDIYTISKEQITGQKIATIHLPEQVNKLRELHLMTDIKVYEDEVLTAYDCSLNLPVRVLDAQPQAGRNIVFWYEMSDKPRFKHELN